MSTQLRLTADTHYSLRFPFSEQFLMNDFPAPLDTRLREAWSFAWDFLEFQYGGMKASMRCIFFLSRCVARS